MGFSNFENASKELGWFINYFFMVLYSGSRKSSIPTIFSGERFEYRLGRSGFVIWLRCLLSTSNSPCEVVFFTSELEMGMHSS